MLKDTVLQPIQLLENLAKLREHGYIFRGLPDARHDLKPFAFRPDNLKHASNEFPINDQEINVWFRNEQLWKNIKSWTPSLRNYDLVIIQRIFNWYIHLINYNYKISKFIEDSSSPEEIKKVLRINYREPDFWIKEDSFIYIMTNVYRQFINVTALDGTSIFKANPDEDLTGFEETFLQHYDAGTSVLDWTYDPLVAIYFALDLDNEIWDKDKSLFLAKKIPSNYFAIYAYKQISTVNSPVLIKNKSDLIDNPRANAQKGTFTYFTMPCSFYLENEKFPSVEFYDENFKKNYINPTFDLIEYTVPRNNDTLNFFQTVLKDNGISKTTLLLDPDNGIGSLFK